MDELTKAMSSVDCLPESSRLIMPLPRRVTKKSGLLFASYVQDRESSSSSDQDLLPLPPSIPFKDVTQTPSSATVSQPRAAKPFFQDVKKILEPLNPLTPAPSSTAIIQPRPLKPLHPNINEMLESFSPDAQSTAVVSQERVVKPLPRRFSQQLALIDLKPQITAQGYQRQESELAPPYLISHLRVPNFNPIATPHRYPTRAHAFLPQHYSPSTYVKRLKQAQAAAKALVIFEQRYDVQQEKLRIAGRILGHKMDILDLEKPDLAVNDYERRFEALEDKFASLRLEKVALNNRLRAGIEEIPKMKALRARILE